MDKLIKSTLLSSISAGGRIKAPRQPNIWCGESKNGYTPGDLVDANGLVDFIIENDVIHDDPEFLRLKAQIEQEVVDRTAAIAAMREYINQLIQELIGASTPEALDTLAEIAEVLLNDPDIINEILARLNTIETTYATVAQLEDTELVTSAALNDLNSRVDLLETSNMTEITYADLVTLRDNSQLIKGHLYRITDYVTTTAQDNTQSAGHAFDIVVVALDESHLCEKAFATPHAGDTYFADCKMEAWELKYCLDNDATKYAWADATNGKGVIWWMKDEWGNECPYDFKNILYNKYKTVTIYTYYGTSYYGEYSRYAENDTIINNVNYYGYKRINSSDGPLTWPEYLWANVDTPSSSGMEFYVVLNNAATQFEYPITILSYSDQDILGRYTFCYLNHETGQYSDTSLNISNSIYSNVIDKYIINDKLKLNENIICGTGCNCNIFAENCYENTLNQSSIGNIFGRNCRRNYFGVECGKNILEDDCYTNVFGSQCSGNILRKGSNKNTFESSCENNEIGCNCHSNLFERLCSRNILKLGCHSNTFRFDNVSGTGSGGNILLLSCMCISFNKACYHNIVKQNCSYITFGVNCTNNTFDSHCYNIALGDACSYNSFGKWCHNITFGDSSSLLSYCRYITIESANEHIYFNTLATTSESNPLRNIKIAQGVNNTTTWKTITHATTNDTFQTVYKPVNSVEVSV